MAISLRPMESGDFAYVKSTIRGTLLSQSAYCKGLHPATIDVLLDPILAAYNTTLAVDSDDPSEAVGFVVYRDATDVAFVYVRAQFRKKKIGRALLEHAGITWESEDGEGYVDLAPAKHLTEVICPLMVTNLTGQNFPRLAERKGYRLRFRPYAPLEIAAETTFGRKNQ